MKTTRGPWAGPQIRRPNQNRGHVAESCHARIETRRRRVTERTTRAHRITNRSAPRGHRVRCGRIRTPPRAHRPLPPRRHSPHRLPAPDPPGLPGNRRYFFLYRLLRRRRPRNRNALLQFRSAEHSRIPSRARRYGYLLSGFAERREDPAPSSHAHLAHADSHHGKAKAARARHRSRQGLSPPQSRRHPFLRLPPDRRPGRRHGYHLLRFHRHYRIFRKTVFRPQRENSFPPQLFPINRADLRIRRLLPLLPPNRKRLGPPTPVV